MAIFGYESQGGLAMRAGLEGGHSDSMKKVLLQAKIQMAFTVEQGRIHGIRCSETPLKEKALRTLRTDGRTDRASYRGASSHLKILFANSFFIQI